MKPRLRGRLHQVAFFASIPAGAALVLVARTAPARVAAAVYALSLAGLYGTSAAFHLGRWSAKAHRRMDQADHAMIYVLIAGSYVTLPSFAGRLGVAKLTLLVAGGVLYTVGAVVLGYQRPNPNPRVFGYHEVWHAFTVAAGLCHYVLILLLVRAAA